jgi:hypothetical protein
VSAGPPPDCSRYDRRVVLRQERGQTGGEPELHLASCARCQQLDARTAALREELGRLPVPPSAPHWEQAVFARIAAGQAPARRPRPARSLQVAFGAALAVAVAALVVLIRLPPREDQPGYTTETLPPPPPAPVLVALAHQPPAARMRSEGEPLVGGTTVVKATGPLPANTEVRIYRDDAGLQLRCSDQPPCTRTGNGLEVRFLIPAIGRYRVVVVVGADRALPAPGGSYDADMTALIQAGIPTPEERVYEVW